MWDIQSSLQHAKSLSSLVVSCGHYFSDQGSNPSSQHWEHSLSHWTTREVPKAKLFLLTKFIEDSAAEQGQYRCPQTKKSVPSTFLSYRDSSTARRHWNNSIPTLTESVNTGILKIHCAQLSGGCQKVSDSEISSFLQPSFATGMHDIKWLWFFSLCEFFFFLFFLPNRYNLFVPSFGFIFIPIIKVVFGLPTASFQLLGGFGCYLFNVYFCGGESSIHL